MDMISNLPNEIIWHIGSFLSAKEAAFATVLSKRWRNLFTIIPELGFYNNGWIGYPESQRQLFAEFSDQQVLALPLNSRIGKFCLTWEFEEVEPALINHCLSHALKLGVVDLYLRVIVGDGVEERYSVPLEVFTCKTIVKLSLGFGFVIEFLPTDLVFLPALKTLCLSSIRFEDPSTFNTLLSACPVLEELEIFDLREWKWSRTVSSPTLKRLIIHHEDKDQESDDDSEYESISFDTPALTYLKYLDFARKEYPIVNLESLVEADLTLSKDENILSDPTNLFNGLKNVEILTVCDESLDLIREAVPVFENLSDLTLVNSGEYCWFGPRVLLQKSPKLKTLTIIGGLHCNEEDGHVCECLLGYSFLSTCRIEVVKIMVLEGNTGEMLQVKLFLENLLYLELLEIHVKRYADADQEKRITKDLLKIPRASSKCKIHVVSRYGKVCDEIEEEEEKKTVTL